MENDLAEEKSIQLPKEPIDQAVISALSSTFVKRGHATEGGIVNKGYTAELGKFTTDLKTAKLFNPMPLCTLKYGYTLL